MLSNYMNATKTLRILSLHGGSGKALIVASTGGNVQTDVEVDGKPVFVGLNAYIGSEHLVEETNGNLQRDSALCQVQLWLRSQNLLDCPLQGNERS